MCGICGIIKFDGSKPDPQAILNMMQIMKHRGPDDQGTFFNDNVGLGHVRLSIIDLSEAGHQPMFSSDGRYCMIYNGEIYNYIELKEELIKLGRSFKTQTDSEVLLEAYCEWGEKCLDRLNGMFAFAIYDIQERSIFCVRDRYGIKPFYYLHEKNIFAFCSEIPPLLTLLDNKPEPDQLAIFDYLTFNRTDQGERTFFKNIKKLQHGHTLKIKDRNTIITRWYDLSSKIIDVDISAEKYLELFDSSLKLRLRSDVPVGVCLSGGLDSSSIVADLVKIHNLTDLHTFSAVHGKGVTGDESEFIDEFKPILKNMHYTSPTMETLYADLEIFIRCQGEPVPSTSPYAQFKVMELAKKNVVVTLDGQGADECLAGYHYFFGFYFYELLRKFKFLTLSIETFNYLKNHKSIFGLKSLAYFLLPKDLQDKNRIASRNYLDHDFQQLSKESSLTSDLYSAQSLRKSLINHFEHKLEHLLKWEDRNSMWFSLESRIPFLDYRLVEATLGLPANRIINKGTTKKILRDAMQGILPEKIRNRRDKIGFLTPESIWFRQPGFQVLISELINSKSFSQRGYFNPKQCQLIYNQHLNGKKDASRDIWKWIHLEMWAQMFIDN